MPFPSIPPSPVRPVTSTDMNPDSPQYPLREPLESASIKFLRKNAVQLCFPLLLFLRDFVARNTFSRLALRLSLWFLLFV